MALIHTIGYEKRTLAEYIGLLQDAGVTLVVDVRQVAWSHKPGFSKSAFQRELAAAGIGYVHAAFAGNPKALRVGASSHAEVLARYRRHLESRPDVVDQLEAELYLPLLLGEVPALTCFERHPDDCHRSILAAAWADRDPTRQVVHLAGDGCARWVRA